MREGSVRVRDGQVGLTDATLAKLTLPKSSELQVFLHDRLGYTEARIKELLGAGFELPTETT